MQQIVFVLHYAESRCLLLALSMATSATANRVVDVKFTNDRLSQRPACVTARRLTGLNPITICSRVLTEALVASHWCLSQSKLFFSLEFDCSFGFARFRKPPVLCDPVDAIREPVSRNRDTATETMFLGVSVFSGAHRIPTPRQSPLVGALEFPNAIFRLPPNFRRRMAPGNACNKRPVVLGTFQSFPCPVCPFFSLVKVWMWSCMSFSPSLSHRTSVSSELSPLLTKKDRSRLLVSFLHGGWRGSREQTCHRLPDIAVGSLRF